MIRQENEDIEVLERIRAMRSQETHSVCHNYLTTLVDATTRVAMTEWCFCVCDSLDISREAVGIAMSILDRYISSGKGSKALQTKQKYQLAVITSFFMAVKIHEHVQLGIELLIKLCRGYYTEKEICATELDILKALEWRVYTSSVSPMAYVRYFLELIPMSKGIADIITRNATVYNDRAATDIQFSTCRASDLGVVCLAGALNDTFVITQFKKEMMWLQLSRKLGDFDIASNEIRRIETLLTKIPTFELNKIARVSPPCRNIKNEAREQQPSSPVSVMQMAR